MSEKPSENQNGIKCSENVSQKRKKTDAKRPGTKAGTLIGYARVSTDDQRLALQQDALGAAGCDSIYEEKASGKSATRPELENCLKALRPGDSLVVWRLDRLGRSLGDLVAIVTGLGARGIGFESLTEKIDTNSATGKLVFHLFAALAEFERNLIRERTMAGLDAARQRGRIGGRKPKVDSKVKNKILAMKAGKMRSVKLPELLDWLDQPYMKHSKKLIFGIIVMNAERIERMLLQPKLNTLPDSQRELWPQLKDVPKEFVLYGGTAVALRYGHRESIDFDFFTTVPVNLSSVSRNLPFIKKYEGVVDDNKTDQQIDYILTIGDSKRNKVQVTFMNNRDIAPGSINSPDTVLGPGIKIASPLDLLGCKILAASERTEKKDFQDIAELIKNKISLQKGFEASVALARLSPLGMGRLRLYNLKEDLQAKTLNGILPEHPECVELLREAASKVNVDKAMKTTLKAIPELIRSSGLSR